MPKITVPVTIAKEDMLTWYRGEKHRVRATALDGRSVEFPIAVLRPFVGPNGVSGLFQLEFDMSGKFVGIAQVRR